MENKKFTVGYARVVITPENGTGLGGYGNSKSRTSVGKFIEDDDLFCTALAITGTNGETLIWYTVDDVRTSADMSDAAKKNLATLGIKPENVMMCATHSHSTPDANNVPHMKPWLEKFDIWAFEAAKQALADQVPAEIFVGKKEVEGLNYVRRYMKDGKFYGTNAVGDAHETKADGELLVIKFAREGKKDVVLANWGAHPDHSSEIGGPSGTPEYHRGVSADYVYAVRKSVETENDVLFAFFQAAAGNLNPFSKIKEEMQWIADAAKEEGIPRFVKYGNLLGAEVNDIVKNKLTKVEAGEVKTVSSEFTVHRAKGLDKDSSDFRKCVAVSAVLVARELAAPTPESIEAADFLIEKHSLGDRENVEKLFNDDSNIEMKSYAAAVKVLTEGGKIALVNQFTSKAASEIRTHFGYISGPYYCNSLVSQALNSDLPDLTVPFTAACFGDVAVCGAPGEIFDSNAKDVKDASPFKMTFYCEQTNIGIGYVPTKLAWSHGGYEVASARHEIGTGEKLSEKFIEALNSFKN